MFCITLHLFIFTSYVLLSAKSESISIGWQSFIDLSSSRFEFYPIDMAALLLDEISVDSMEICASMCHSTALCRTFDCDTESHRCRIFQGDSATTGSIGSSSSPYSVVGSVELDHTMFASFGEPCSFCQSSRYLQCINSTCQCQPNTYFDGSICQSQKLLGAACTDEINCRIDRNYTCLPRLQCGPLSIQNGTTVGGYENGTAGSANNALNQPSGLAMGVDSSLYVAEYGNSRVMRLDEGSTFGTQVAGSTSTGAGSNQLAGPTSLYIDALSNIYVADDWNYRVMRWGNGSSSGTQVAGTGVSGVTLSTLSQTHGVTVDSHGNVYVSEKMNYRVTRWAPNATNATIVAGENTIQGSNSNQLSLPYGLYLDELHSYLYIADAGNNRIQRITLNGSTNATTVAGGNGAGSNNNQLNNPMGVYVSKKTGAIYIPDGGNHRIMRWAVGATEGVTIVGIVGQSGTSPMLLNTPFSVVLNLNETFMYVCDHGNNRIQRFQLI